MIYPYEWIYQIYYFDYNRNLTNYLIFSKYQRYFSIQRSINQRLNQYNQEQEEKETENEKKKIKKIKKKIKKNK